MDEADGEGPDPDGYDPAAGTYHAHHPPSADEPVSAAVVATVAAVADEAPAAIQPLYEVVDPDALDALFAAADFEGTVAVTMAGFPVAVHADGEIVVDVDDHSGGPDAGE